MEMGIKGSEEVKNIGVLEKILGKEKTETKKESKKASVFSRKFDYWAFT